MVDGGGVRLGIVGGLMSDTANRPIRTFHPRRGRMSARHTDALTGQGNHGAFQRTLGELVDAAQARIGSGRRRGRPAAPESLVSLLMMDLDRFKGYNDRLGHPAGDALLHAVGTAIYGAALTLRRGDVMRNTLDRSPAFRWRMTRSASPVA